MSVCAHTEAGRMCPIGRGPCPGVCVYSHILHNVSIGIVVLDLERTAVVFVNGEGERLLEGIADPSMFSSVREAFSRDIGTTGEPVQPDARRRLVAGSRTIGYSLYHILEKYVWIFLLDITESQRADEEARLARQMAADVLDNLPQGVFVVSAAGNIEYANPAMASISGCSESLFRGINVDGIEPYRALGLDRRIRDTLDAAIPFVMGPLEYVSEFGRKKTTRMFHGIPLRFRSERKALVFVEDLTDMARIEDENALLAAAVKSAENAVIITDTEGLIRYVNPACARVTLHPETELLGTDIHDLQHGPEGERVNREMWERLAGGEGWTGGFTNRKADGTSYEEAFSIYPVKKSDGAITNYVATKKDVTEQVRLESIAETVNMMNNLGFVFSGIRHEIGNPINAVKVTLEVLKANIQKYPTEKAVEYLDRGLDALRRVEYLLRALKSFNMFEKPDCKDVHLTRFAESFRDLVIRDLERRGIELKTIVHPDAGWAFVDPRALQQVLLNLITNAADAVDGVEAPKIVVSAFCDEGKIKVRVMDNGCGMPEDMRRNPFRPFYTTKPQGTGLGLVIVRKMLSQMGSTIEITSEQDAGTIVDITLPPAERKERGA